jgi:hypothetical protein
MIKVGESPEARSRSYSVHRATDDEFGTEPYVFTGAYRPTSIEGMRPMSVTGDLANAMPAEWFEVAARAR